MIVKIHPNTVKLLGLPHRFGFAPKTSKNDKNFEIYFKMPLRNLPQKDLF